MYLLLNFDCAPQRRRSDFWKSAAYFVINGHCTLCNTHCTLVYPQKFAVNKVRILYFYWYQCVYWCKIQIWYEYKLRMVNFTAAEQTYPTAISIQFLTKWNFSIKNESAWNMENNCVRVYVFEKNIMYGESWGMLHVSNDMSSSKFHRDAI